MVVLSTAPKYAAPASTETLGNVAYFSGNFPRLLTLFPSSNRFPTYAGTGTSGTSSSGGNSRPGHRKSSLALALTPEDEPMDVYQVSLPIHTVTDHSNSVGLGVVMGGRAISATWLLRLLIRYLITGNTVYMAAGRAESVALFGLHSALNSRSRTPATRASVCVCVCVCVACL